MIWPRSACRSGMAIIMFMIVIVSAIPMMQGVIEEKQLRIAEVLLASVQPFELMSGKLIGMFAVSATLVAISTAGGGGGGGVGAGLLAGLVTAASHLHLISQYVSAGTLAWFVAFQILAVMMFGSMYIAIGASCSDMREGASAVAAAEFAHHVTALAVGNGAGTSERDGRAVGVIFSDGRAVSHDRAHRHAAGHSALGSGRADGHRDIDDDYFRLGGRANLPHRHDVGQHGGLAVADPVDDPGMSIL